MALMQELISLAIPHTQLCSSSCRWQTASRGQCLTLPTGAPCSSPSVWCLRGDGFSARQATPDPLSGRKIIAENRWREFFSDPSQWWDHRSEKVNPRYPDFKHKETQQSLWLSDNLTPPWVASELAAMAIGTLQSNIFSWNIKLRRYVKAGDYKRTVELFQQMQGEGMKPDKFTFLPVLNACSGLRSLEEGRRVHEQIIERGYGCNLFVGNCLVDMYSKCGSIEDARTVFNKMPIRNVVTWSAMILGYVKCGEGQKSLELYHQMKQEGVDPNPVTFVAVLNACTSLAALQEGRSVHELIIEKGYECDIFVGSCLIDMYAKCGTIGDARRVFNNISTLNVVAWSAMIMGYVRCGEGQMALELYRQMLQEGVDPNSVTFVAVLNACANVAALEEGRNVHELIIERGYAYDVFVANSLIDMYAKCASIVDARRVFNKMPTRNVVSWNAMLAGFGRHGYAREALEHFERMSAVVDVNSVTLVCLLSACSHGGLVNEGLHYFRAMIAVFKISPTVEHYACVVDLLGRAGRLHEAVDLIRSMPCEADATLWISLLGACRNHRNVEMGEYVAKQVLELNPGNAACYVLLSNMYAAAGKLDSSTRVQQERLAGSVGEIEGRTWIEVNKNVHSFTVDENQHPDIVEICAEVKRLSRTMEEAGYVPDTRSPLLCGDENRKFCLSH